MAQPTCKYCFGPIQPLPLGRQLVWTHDNSASYYAGRQMNHDAELSEYSVDKECAFCGCILNDIEEQYGACDKCR
jgi:hypothetical protein